MPVNRQETLAHFSPPKTVRTTPPPETRTLRSRCSTSSDTGSQSFWDPVKMGRLNASLARRRQSLGDPWSGSGGRCTSYSLADGSEGELGSPTTGAPQLPTFAALQGVGVRESKSPSISMAAPGTTEMPSQNQRKQPQTSSAAAMHHSHGKAISRSLGLLSSADEDAWSAHGGGLSVSAGRRSLSSFSSPSPAAALSVRLSGALAHSTTMTPMSRALAEMQGARRGSVAGVSVAFERTEQPRIGYSPRYRAPPTARTYLPQRTTTTTRATTSTASTEQQEGADVVDVVVHTPRVRQAPAPAPKPSKSGGKRTAKAANKPTSSRQPEVSARQRGKGKKTAVPPVSTFSALSLPRVEVHASTDEPFSASPTRWRTSHSPAPLPPQTPHSEDNNEVVLHAACTSEVHQMNPPHINTSMSTSPSVTRDEECVVRGLTHQAVALRHEVQQLEMVKSELETAVQQLVGQLEEASHAMDEADLTQQRQTAVAERLLRSVAADLSLQQNVLVERLALIEEDALGI